MEHTPIGPGEAAVMAPAWASFVDWAFRQPQFLDQFHRETRTRPPPKSAFEAAIDKACGIAPVDVEAYVEKFTDWVTETHWGSEFDPRVRYAAAADDA